MEGEDFNGAAKSGSDEELCNPSLNERQKLDEEWKRLREEEKIVNDKRKKLYEERKLVQEERNKMRKDRKELAVDTTTHGQNVLKFKLRVQDDDMGHNRLKKRLEIAAAKKNWKEREERRKELHKLRVAKLLCCCKCNHDVT